MYTTIKQLCHALQGASRFCQHEHFPSMEVQVLIGSKHWSEMVSLSIKSPGLPFTQNWCSSSHNSIWVGLGCAVLGSCWQDWGSIPCHIPSPAALAQWLLSGCWGYPAFPISIWLHNASHQGGHGALQRALHVCTWPDSGSQEGSCWKDPMSEWQGVRSSLLDQVYLFLPAFMNCPSTVGKKCSISEDCLCSLTPAQKLEYSHFKNSPVFPELRGQFLMMQGQQHRWGKWEENANQYTTVHMIVF